MQFVPTGQETIIQQILVAFNRELNKRREEMASFLRLFFVYVCQRQDLYRRGLGNHQQISR